jgi:disulfide oxidoreductase YuzD
MDPITTAIVTVAGAAGTELATSVIKDSYESLKAALKKKFGSDSDLIDAVEKFEKKPDSEARKATVQEEIEIAKVNDDPNIVKLAQDLLNQIKQQPGGQEIINQTQTNTVSGVNVGGNFEFKPVQEGKKG